MEIDEHLKYTLYGCPSLRRAARFLAVLTF